MGKRTDGLSATDYASRRGEPITSNRKPPNSPDRIGRAAAIDAWTSRCSSERRCASCESHTSTTNTVWRVGVDADLINAAPELAQEVVPLGQGRHQFVAVTRDRAERAGVHECHDRKA